MTKPSYKQWIAACTLTSTLLLGACGSAPVTRDASIVPLPNQIQQSGNAFVLTPNTTIGTPTRNYSQPPKIGRAHV